MKIELDADTVDAVVVDSLRSTYKDMKEYSEKEWESINFPVFSRDKEEDRKKTKKLLTALKLAHNHYAVPDKRL
jgi:hypothetical protein